MTGLLIKLMKYILPFLKEIFINSNEERKVWSIRFGVLCAIVFSVNWYYNHDIRQSNSSLNDEISQLRTQVVNLNGQLSIKERRLDNLLSQLTEKQRGQDRLQTAIHEHEKTISTLRASASTMVQRIEELRHNLMVCHSRELNSLSPDKPPVEADVSTDKGTTQNQSQ